MDAASQYHVTFYRLDDAGLVYVSGRMYDGNGEIDLHKIQRGGELEMDVAEELEREIYDPSCKEDFEAAVEAVLTGNSIFEDSLNERSAFRDDGSE